MASSDIRASRTGANEPGASALHASEGAKTGLPDRQRERIQSIVVELVQHLQAIEETVDRLCEHEPQRQVDRISGKLEAVFQFVSGSIEDKIDARVEKAEVRAFERLLSMVRGSQREIE